MLEDSIFSSVYVYLLNVYLWLVFTSWREQIIVKMNVLLTVLFCFYL